MSLGFLTRKGRHWTTAWVIGASSGIGRELALLLSEQGSYVAASARSADKLKDLAEQAHKIGGYPLDVTDPESVKSSAADIEEASGPIDLVVLCAGAWTISDVAKIDVPAIRKGVEVNYMGAVHVLDAILPGMLARRQGHIVIVASVAGYRGLPRSLAYGPTKAALINLAETLNAELAPHGVKVSLVNPGFVDTALTRDNPFPMPAIMSANAAAKKLLAGLKSERYEIIFPRRFVYPMKLLRIVPNVVFFWIIRKFVLKPPA